jgi:ectoine hydroxylase-related dioxygenase (phytanoyl-CoA dioxygenase family)
VVSDIGARYAADGVVHVPGAFAGWVEPLRDGIDRALAAPGVHARRLSAADAPAPVRSDILRWRDVEPFARFVRDPAVVRLVATVLGTEAVVFLQDQWFVKEPGATTSSPWHQDGPYYNVAGPMCTVWVALDDHPRDVSLELVRGSHRWGTCYGTREFVEGAGGPGAGVPGTVGASDAPPVPDIDAERERYDVVGFDLAAGDAVVFDAGTVHGAPGNRRLDRPARRFSTRWTTPQARYREAGPGAAEFWRLMDHGLADGDRFTGEWFPMLVADEDEGAPRHG